MCGIAGEMRWGGSPPPTDWQRISELMRRRGPDDSGSWSSPDNDCTLVFRRLAILDLNPSGHQPMVSLDGRYVLVFNGEIYNFAELRKELEGKGFRFRSTGDSEVVLNALIQWGNRALERFNGMFALAFYDQKEKRLVLARDHAGIKPLYYLEGPNGVVFGSQYDQLLAHPWSRELPVSREALGLYLRLAYIPAPYAILERTYMLEPGCWREYRAGGSVHTGRYFEFPRWQTPELTGREACEAVDEAVSDAVKRQLVSDVPVAAFLSGGIDSPLITAKMTSFLGSDIEAFTIGTGGDAEDESSDASRYAQELGVRHTLQQVSSDQAFDMLEDVTSACGEPFGDFSIFPTLLVSRLAARQYKVILSGDGGDELFWGYTKRAIPLIRFAAGFRQPHWLRTLRWGLTRLGMDDIPHAFKRFPTLGHWQREKHSHFSSPELLTLFPSLPPWPEDYPPFQFDGWRPDEAAQWLRWNELSTHLTGVLLKVDRASMFHSLEVRVPLLDKEVMAVAARVDWRSALDVEHEKGKLPLRWSLSRHLCHQTSGKKGFSVPMGEWLKGALRPVFEETLLNRKEILGLEINGTALKRLFEKHLQGTDLAWGLWPLLSLALWEKRHFRR